MGGFSLLLACGQQGVPELEPDSVEEPESRGKLGTDWDNTVGPEQDRSLENGACWGTGAHSVGTPFPNDAGGKQPVGSTGLTTGMVALFELAEPAREW